jgi:NADPH:quinone reductase
MDVTISSLALPASAGPSERGERVRAVVVTRSGGPEVLEYTDWETPAPGPGELLVDVSVAGVNYRDVYEREGSYPGPPPPLVAGVEGAGSVAAVGDGVSEFEVGNRVAWSSAPGSYAEQVVMPAGRAVPIPGRISDERAAAALLQGMTAHYLCTSTYPVEAGETAVVHAAAGGVGLLLTQMVKMRGGRVLATTSSEAKAELARAAGADEVLGYDDFGARVRELTGGEGAAVVYDGIGKDTVDASLGCLRTRGMLVLYGGASGPVPPFDLGRLMRGGSLYISRPSLMHYAATREELLARSSAVFGWIADGTLDVRIGGRYPLERAADAHRELESRQTTGKLLLLVR